METFISRIKRLVVRIWDHFQTDRHFSLFYALLRIVDEFARLFHLSNLASKVHSVRCDWILHYLNDQLQSVFDRFEDDKLLGEKLPNAPIWICWWTGVDTAPELVKQCIKSTYRNAGNHPVHLITSKNYHEYLTIPEYMLDKAESGQMGFAHLADYIRVKLLATYGGLWLDATIYCSQEIPAMCFELPMFTCKGPVQQCGYVSNYRWVTFCLGGWKGNVFYRFLVEAFEEYWRNNTYAIDYLFFDYIILAAYNRLAIVKELLDQVPDNNIHRDDLQAAMNAVLPASEFESVLQPDTAMYKLSWREKYSLATPEGRPSIYTCFLMQNL